MSDLLLIAAHPDSKSSFANRILIDEFHKQVPDAEIVYLDKLYPDYKIDAAAEQKRLVAAKTVIFDYPFWWYGDTSLMHAYIEQVFTHGFAYGSGGDKLKKKNLLVSMTVGGSEQDYTKAGSVGYTIEEFLVPMRATANFCGMEWMGAIYSYSMMNYDPSDPKLAEGIKERALAQADKLAKRLLEI